MVGFRDLVGTGIAPVSKKTAVKVKLSLGTVDLFLVATTSRLVCLICTLCTLPIGNVSYLYDAFIRSALPTLKKKHMYWLVTFRKMLIIYMSWLM